MPTSQLPSGKDPASGDSFQGKIDGPKRKDLPARYSTVDGSGQIISRPHEPTDLTPQKVAAFGREMGPRKFQENTGW